MVGLDFPGKEEVFPADKRDNFFERNRRELAFAHERRLHGLVLAPVAKVAAFDRSFLCCGHGACGFGLDAVLLVANALLFFTVFLNGLLASRGVQEFLHEARVTGGVAYVEYGAFVARGNLYGSVRGRGGGTADDNRDALACVLHGFRDRTHFFERRRNQSGKAQYIGLVLDDSLHDDVFGNHHAEVHHFVAVTGHNHGDNILADIVHVALHGGDYDFAAARSVRVLARLDVGLQDFYRLLHGACSFDHLRQEHLAFTEATADFVHAVHKRAGNDSHRAIASVDEFHQVGLKRCRCSLEQSLLQAFFGGGFCLRGVGDAVATRVGTARACAHGENRLRVVLGARFFGGSGGCGHAACNFDERFACIRFRVVDDFGNGHAEFQRNRLVFDNRARVHDGHAHAVRNCVMQEGGVHRFAQVVVTAEGERKVRKTARDAHAGKVVHNPADRTDKVNGVGVVFCHARSDSQNVRIVNDVRRIEAELFDHDIVSAGGNLYAALVVGGLAFFVKEHHDDGSTQTLDGERVINESLFTHLEGNGVHDALALDALEARFDDFESGRVHHDGHAAHGRVRCNQVQEGLHFGGGV